MDIVARLASLREAAETDRQGHPKQVKLSQEEVREIEDLISDLRTERTDLAAFVRRYVHLFKSGRGYADTAENYLMRKGLSSPLRDDEVNMRLNGLIGAAERVNEVLGEALGGEDDNGA